MNFKEFMATESWFTNLFSRPQKQVAPEELVQIRHTPPSPPMNRKDQEKVAGRYGEGSLFQALTAFEKLNSEGYYYPPRLLIAISSNQKFNDDWNAKYRNMFTSALQQKQPVTARMIITRAFEEMGIPEPQVMKPAQPQRKKFSLPPAPELKQITVLIQQILQDRSVTAEKAKDIIVRRYPQLYEKYKGWADAQIGRAFKSATRPQLFRPEEEEPEVTGPQLAVGTGQEEEVKKKRKRR
jgi:hypothetical protein